jgi:hypothetical protein
MHADEAFVAAGPVPAGTAAQHIPDGELKPAPPPDRQVGQPIESVDGDLLDGQTELPERLLLSLVQEFISA